MDVHQLDTFLLAGGAVVFAAILAVRASVRVGLPGLLCYLLIGVVLGEAGFGVRFDDAGLAHALGFAALVIILTEGGLTTKWSDVRSSMPLGVLLATLGVGLSVLVVTVAGHFLLGFSWDLALLLGAVTAPTDAAAVFSTLRKVPLPRRLSGALEAESGLNDAPTVLLVTLLSTGAIREDGPVAFVLGVGYELVAGAGLGFCLGWVGVLVLRRVALPASGLYPLAVLTLAVLAYASASSLHQSGFAAVYVAALVLGNGELPHRTATRSFAEGLAWIAQIGLFVMLGLLAWPSRLSLTTVVGAVVIGVVLTFLARPLSVFVSSLPFRLPLREQAFLSWAGLRGAVPIVLATIPLSHGAPGADPLFDVVFLLVVALTVLQSPTLPWAAKVLGVVSDDQTRDIEVEAAPLDAIDADLIWLRIREPSKLHGVEIAELRLPEGASVALVVRRGDSFVPGQTSVLRRGDEMLVVAPRRLRDATERRLRAVSQAGRLARWLGPGRSSPDR